MIDIEKLPLHIRMELETLKESTGLTLDDVIQTLPEGVTASYGMSNWEPVIWLEHGAKKTWVSIPDFFCHGTNPDYIRFILS